MPLHAVRTRDMIDDPLVLDTLDRLDKASSSLDTNIVLEHAAHTLLAAPERVAGLVRSVAGAGDLEETRESSLLGRLVDEARMSVENGGEHGESFLSALVDQITALIADNALTEKGAAVLARSYSRADLPVPAALSDWIVMQLGQKTADFDPAEMKRHMTRMLKHAGQDAYGTHEAMKEALAVAPAEVKAAMIGLLGERPEAAVPRLLLFWLLDSDPALRQAAASAFLNRAKSGHVSGEAAARLVQIRAWLPDDPARATLDEAIRALTGRTVEAARGRKPTAPTIESVLVSLPDGSESQQFAAIVRRGKQRKLAFVLLKAGHGVKDGFVLSDREDGYDMTLDAFSQVGVFEVPSETLADALAMAGGEAVALGIPPAPALIEVLDICGFHDLRPVSASLDDWRALADPEGAVAAMTPQKRGRLINASADWPEQFPFVTSWFEDSAPVRAAVRDAATREDAIRAVRSVVDAQREVWARRLFRGAHVLRGAGLHQHCEEFVAVAHGLLDGRPLQKTPIAEWMIENTVDVHGETPMSEPPADLDEDEAMALLSERARNLGLGGSERGVMETLLEYFGPPGAGVSPMTAMEVDGYLAALAAGPVTSPPNVWLAQIWETDGPPFETNEEAAKIVGALLARYNTFLEKLSEGEPIVPLLMVAGDDSPEDDDEAPRCPDPAPWMEGFRYAMSLDFEDWEPILDDPDGVFIRVFMAFWKDDDGTPVIPLPDDARAEMIASAPEMISHVVHAINDYWAERSGSRRGVGRGATATAASKGKRRGKGGRPRKKTGR